MLNRFRKPATIRAHLTSLVTVCVVPVWLLAAILVYQAYTSMVNQAHRDMLETARAMTKSVDAQLSGAQAALTALATSPSFTRGDLREVHLQGRQLLAEYPGADIIVADGNGQQVVNSFRPFGSPLPKRNNLDTVRRIFTSGQAVVSNLFFGAVTKRPLIAIDVPVVRNGKVLYDLSMTFPSENMMQILARYPLPTGWYASIHDSNRVIVARTASRNLVGKKVVPELQKLLSEEREGAIKVTNREGIKVFASFSRSPLSGWAVSVGVPETVLMAKIFRWMFWAVLGALTLSLLCVAVALNIAGRISRSIDALREPALSIGRGEPVQPPGVQQVRETVEVANALVQASELLQQHEAEAHRYTTRLLELEDGLRKNLARELHDHIGQELAVLGLNLSFVANALPQGVAAQLRSRLEAAMSLGKSINRTVRTIMAELHPLQIEEYGLVSAIRSHVDEYAARTGVRVEVLADAHFPRLAAQDELALFRIAQEALVNVAKHAEAMAVEFAITSGADEIAMRIRDDGQGFPPAPHGAPPLPSGWGLTLMRERAESICGRFEVVTKPGRGTTVSVVLKRNAVSEGGGGGRGARGGATAFAG